MGLVVAQTPSSKRELRGTWLTTVTNMDWPDSTLVTIPEQQSELCRLLDSVKALNFNTIFFHIRPDADAFYRSDYEPWSSFLNHGRGVDPGYDPLTFCIDECHKRGLTCHGWINPYRYCYADDWKGKDSCALNYSVTHPDWILWYKDVAILDPANPEVLQRIKDVVGDILTKYDIDGILMDDYFYPYGGTKDQDSVSVGRFWDGTTDIHDWRRENVNRMVKALYDTIQAVKPWVYYGVSPFGIWTMSDSVASLKGLTLPEGIKGGDMYKQIYCDPVAWIQGRYVDYVSPQLYWARGGKQDFGTLCNWWDKLCTSENVQFFPSMGVFNYTRDDFNLEEIPAQVPIARKNLTPDAQGLVFFNTTDWNFTSKAPALRELLRPLFSTPTLQPVVGWKSTPVLPCVKDLRIENNTLRWTAPAEGTLRYAVYAIPAGTKLTPAFFNDTKYLLDVTYATEYTIPTTDNTYVVSVIDRYNNEYSFTICGGKAGKNKPVRLIGCENGVFSWKGGKVISYQFQLCRDAQCKDIVFSVETTQPMLDSKQYSFLQKLQPNTYYWRIRTSILNVSDTWSEPQVVAL